jgi:hypothetical protein
MPLVHKCDTGTATLPTTLSETSWAVYRRRGLAIEAFDANDSNGRARGEATIHVEKSVHSSTSAPAETLWPEA